MAWTTKQWAVCCGLLEHAFDAGRLGRWTDATEHAYKIVLDKHDPASVAAAIQAMVDGGQTFRPLPGDIIAALRADPTKPSWPEAYRDIRRALACRGAQRYHAPGGEKEAACTAWLREFSHDLVAAFFEAETYERLSVLPIDDPDYGQLEIERLRKRWEEFTGRAEERMAQGLSAGVGARRQLGPRRPDFAGVLPAGPEPGGDA